MAHRGLRKGRVKKKAAQREKRAEPAAEVITAPPPEPARKLTLVHGHRLPPLGERDLESTGAAAAPDETPAPHTNEGASGARTHKRRSRKKHDPAQQVKLQRVAIYVGIAVLVALVVLIVLQRVDAERAQRDPGHTQSAE